MEALVYYDRTKTRQDAYAPTTVLEGFAIWSWWTCETGYWKTQIIADEF